VSQRLEGIEDALDRLDQRLNRADGTRGLQERLEKIEAALARLEATGSGSPSTRENPTSS
jgi:archaellum component FlaC